MDGEDFVNFLAFIENMNFRNFVRGADGSSFFFRILDEFLIHLLFPVGIFKNSKFFEHTAMAAK